MKDEAPSKGDKVLKGAHVPIGGKRNEVPVVPTDLRSGENRDALLAQSRVMSIHVTRDVGTKVNNLESTMKSRLRDFVRMILKSFETLRRKKIRKSFLLVCTRCSVPWW